MGSSNWVAPWRDLRWAFAAVWLLFLTYPVVAVTSSDTLGTSQRLLTLVALGAFAIVYLLACVYVLFGRNQIDPRPLRSSSIVFVMLLVLSGVVAANIDEGVFALAPYLMALAAFAFPLPVAVTVCVLLTACAVLLPEMVAGWEIDPSIVVMLLVVGPTLLAVRTVRVREELREEHVAAERELNSQLAIIGERERVARDVHDILGHSLTVMTLKSELASRLVDTDPDAAKAELADLHRISREALAEVRATVGGLRSPDLATELLAAQTALTAAQITPDLPSDESVVDPQYRILFAWTLREAVTNVVRHSGAIRCQVSLTSDGICVSDDGKGLSGMGIGNGLRGLAERVEAAGGTLTVAGDQEAGNHGTSVKVQM